MKTIALYLRSAGLPWRNIDDETDVKKMKVAHQQGTMLDDLYQVRCSGFCLRLRLMLWLGLTLTCKLRLRHMLRLRLRRRLRLTNEFEL